MSHPLYNPYSSGNQSSSQGQYGLSNTQAEKDAKRASSFLGSGSSFSSSGASSAVPANSGQMFSSMISQSINYRSDPSRPAMVEDTDSSVDMHTSRSREESNRPCPSTQRDEFHSSGTGMDWSTNYRRTAVDGSVLNSSALSSYASSGDCRLNNPNERERDMQAIPGLGDYDYQVSDKPAASTESSQPKYTSESAASILLRFGLEKEDLEHLISYPEDQITPANLPFILRQICLEKEKKATTAVHSKPYPEPQPTRNVSGVDSYSLKTSGGPGMLQEKSSSVLQPTKVIDYGHTGKYTAGVGDDMRRTNDKDNSAGSGSLLLTDSSAKRQSRDLPSSFTSLSSSYSSVLSSAASPSNEQTKRLQTQSNQTLQNILNCFSLPKKSTDISVLNSEASKPVPLTQLEGDRQSTFQTLTPSNLSHGVYPSRPGLVLIGNNDASGTKDHSKTQGQSPIVIEHIQRKQGQQKEQMQQQSTLQAQVQQMPKQPTQKMQHSKQQTQQPQKHQLSQIGQAMWLPVLGKLVPPAGVTRSLKTVPTSKTQPKAKRAVSKALPTPEMMHDYAAASPRIFPHTCSLCNKECTDMKDWISHQNSSLHLKSCTLLRKQFPKWDGEIALGPRAAGKKAKPSTSTSAQKTTHTSSSPSKSPNPYHQHGPESRREKRRSRSRSPQSSRYNHRSWSRSCSPRYDHPRSRSSEGWSSPRRKDERPSPSRKGRNRGSPSARSNDPPRRSDTRRSPARRGNERWSPPRMNDERWSPSKRVGDRRSPPRRRNESWSALKSGDERLSPQRRVGNKWSPPRRVNERLSPQRKSFERWSSPRKSDESRSPPRRSHERVSSREGSSPKRKSSNSAESLAKKLLETSAVQSLSNQSDLETVVKTLAPALLAELAKLSSSSSTSSFKGGKPSFPPSSSRGKKSSATSSSFTGGMKGSSIIPLKAKVRLQKSEASCSTKTKTAKVSPPTMVKLQGICEDLSHNDVVAAMGHFGKIKSVLLFRAKLEANVCFEKEEDAKKLKSLKSLDIKGTTITVVKEQKDLTRKQIKPPSKKPATSSVSHPHTTHSMMSSTTRKALLPTPRIPPLMETLACGAKKSTAGKCISQKSAVKDAKVLVKGVRTVNKAKVLVSKAKYVSSKQMAKTTKTTKLPAMSPFPKSSKQKPVLKKTDTSVEGNVVRQKETAQPGKSAKKTITKATKGPMIEDKLSAGRTVKEEKAVKDTTMLSKTIAATDQTDTDDFKQQLVPEVIVKGPVVKLKEAAEVDMSENRTNTEPAQGPLAEEKVLESKGETALSLEKPNAPTEKQAAKEAERLESVAKDATVPPKSEASENLPDGSDSKQKPVPEKPETSVKLSALGLEEAAKVNKSEDRTNTEPAQCPLVEEKVLASKAETVSSMEKPKTEVHKFAESETVTNENVTETAAKNPSVPSRSTALNSQPDAENSKDGEPETKVKESLEVPKDTAEVAEKADETVRAEDTEPMELGETGVKAAELMEGGSCVEGTGKETSTEAVPEKSADKPRESQPPTSPVVTQPAETSVKALTKVQQSTLPEPESTHGDPETKIQAAQVQQQAAGSTNEAAVEPLMPGEGAETKTTQKVKKSEQQLAASKPSSFSVHHPTIGEMLENHFFPNRIECYSQISSRSYSTLKPGNRPLLITGLPTYYDGCYTEEDVANLLVTYGFQLSEDKIYVIPQKCAAFAMMPATQNVINIVNESRRNGIYFKGRKLIIQVVVTRCTLTPLQFYRFLKRQMDCSQNDEGRRTFLIKNVSQSDARELREALKEFGSVANFTPLLNKLFVEFKSLRDVDRFEVWYSHLNRAPGYEVVYLKKPLPDTTLTFGELLGKHLTKEKIQSLVCKTSPSPKLLITWLPVYGDGCYTEDDVTKLLIPFGYQHKDQNIYVVPQARVAFVLMPTAESVLDIIGASKQDPIILKGSRLGFHVLTNRISMKPNWFYESLMNLLDHSYQKYTAERVIFIRNVSPSETRDLKDALRKISSVFNFLPLLNKVFIEFETVYDVDRLGVWYSLLKHVPAHRVQRLRIPYSGHCLPPSLPENAVPDSKDVIDGVTVLPMKVDVPRGSSPPFWVTMRNSPFVFPTISPWFVIPEYHTVKSRQDIEKACRRGLMCPTLMLTGLPDCRNYRHEDVARLVWRYFLKQTIHSLYYNLIVLPLQRRAFVFFPDWTTCCEFVQDHIANRISFKGHKITVHFVLRHMYPEFSEEMMYRKMMKWSNVGVPDSNSLEERLLCVEISEASVDVITLVIEMVASITPFVNFLPLANRICIEMADPSAVTQVVETYHNFSPNSFTEDPAWSKVQHFETLKSLKQRLQDSAEVIIKLEQDTKNPEIDTNLLKAIRVTVGQHRLVEKSRSQSEEMEVQEDFTDDNFSSDAYLFDEQQFNEEDFITIEEVGDDTEDKSPEPHHTSSSRYSHKKRRRQSSSVSSDRERTSTRSSEEYKSSASSSSTSSRSIKGLRSSHSDFVSRNSSKPTKSISKPSSFASTGEASSASPTVSTKSPSPAHTQQSSTKSPACNTSSNRTYSFSPEIKSAPAVEASKETHPEEAKDTESAVAKSGHRVSAEGSAAKSDESEAKIEAARGMHSPQQGRGLKLSQAQSLDRSFNVNTLIKQNKEDGEQERSSETQLTGPEEGLVLDSVEDGGKARPEEYSETETEDSLQVPESLKDKAATGEEDRSLVQDESSTVQQPSEEDEDPVVDKSEGTTEIKDDVLQETNDKDNFQVIDSGSKGDGKKTKQEDEEGKMASAESCKDAENLQSQLSNEDQSLQEGDVKDHDRYGTEQEAFEVLDSIDDQTETEDVLETSNVQISKEDGRPIEEEDPDAFQVIDSLEDQQMDQETESDSENKQNNRRTKNREATVSKDDRPSRRSGPKSKVSISEKKEVTEETLYTIVDSVEEAAATERSGRRRSTRGKKEDKVKIHLTEASEKPEEVTYENIDSVENKTANDKPIITTRSTRGRRGNTMREALGEKTGEEDKPTRRRQTPARESRSREKTPKTEEKAPPKESTPTKKTASVVEVSEEDATYEILDSVEDEVVEEERPATRGKGKRGRPKKHVKTTKKGSTASKKVDKDASEKVADEEETTYRIVDSVEDETADDQPHSDQSESAKEKNISKSINKEEQKNSSIKGSTKNNEEEEEEPLFQIVDSLEDDPVQEELTATEVSDKERQEKTKTKETEKDKTPTSRTTVSEASEKCVVKEEGLHQRADDVEKVNDPPSLVEGSSAGKNKRTPTSDIKKEETSPIKSTSDTVKLERKNKQKSPEKKLSASTLVNLDEVSDEEENYPDDTAEEEELRKRQAVAKKKQLTNEWEERRTRERERRGSRGEGDGGGTGRGKKRVREDDKVELDTQELVTLDEVGADEAERQQWEEEVTEGEVQELVTLDEFVEEEPEGKTEQRKLETPSLSQEDEAVDDLNQETLVTLDEAGYDEEDKPDEDQAEKPLRSEKCKHDEDTEESMNFVIVDELKDEEKRETITAKTRGRAKKRARQTPVRKSTRGKNLSSQEEREEEEKEPADDCSLEASSSLDLSKLSNDGQEAAEVEAVSQPDTDCVDEGEEEEEREGSIKVVSKRRREPDGPVVKRSRSQSPCVTSDFKLPEFKPNTPLGKEFVVPGFFCNLCSVFYPNESTAKELHCSSQTHYNNLKKHYQKLHQK